ncbi:MAG: (deoxy)nucleoside triphosphate pyrophosphohydrolase [Treponema sp.]|nr:(deoxy)nucleoside triphosphate pyrophosphohydrolase [Treponema sp.]
MKTIKVVAALIFRTNSQNNIEIFATQRGYGEYKDWWEFPGGKVEEGESPEAALAREIQEELATEIRVGDYIDTIEYDYPDFHLSMRCYKCFVISGKLKLLEHENAVWLTVDNLRSVNWLPADITILDKVQKMLSSPSHDTIPL